MTYKIVRISRKTGHVQYYNWRHPSWDESFVAYWHAYRIDRVLSHLESAFRWTDHQTATLALIPIWN